MKTRHAAWLLFGALALAGCAHGPAQLASAPAAVKSLGFLGSVVITRDASALTRDLGGISGADRDPATNTWYLLSDDRSDKAPARFYTAAIDVNERGFKSIHITSAVSLKRPDGSLYPAPKAGGEVADPEAIRFDPATGTLFWSSEGDRRLGLSPFVRQSTRDGAFAGEVALPANLATHKDTERGARNNLAIEGMAFTPSGGLWVAMEAPLYEDGPAASRMAGAVARFTRLDANRRVTGQYAYPADAIPRDATGGKLRSDNGVSEILAVDEDTLLVIERCGYEVAELVFQFAIRIYEVKLGAATNIAGVDSLAGARYVPMSKRLVLDLNQAGIGSIDNIEAAAWGPRLANGNATLILISDDNFAPQQVNQFLAFEVAER
ncbi:esterase-like activity of phytase family protein [Ramlibacter sp. WS9]|uniref:esterase-like activity of phytase family protein n=1 Tax=Ramlibacter sp. WS9 TaxID=1882741 RepID=UPI0013053818|nr:esterase-like activity of phytase family protein [Ramlibacter sp. WS9]